MKIVDARNLACPEPVMLTMKALEEEDQVVTIVDNKEAQENVSRLAISRGCKVLVEQKQDGIYLTINQPVKSEKNILPDTRGTVLLIGSDVLGRGDDQLGTLLMQKFLHTLTGLTSRPEMVLLVNSGVKLATKGSLTAEALRLLEDQGVEIRACGTCLSHFHLADKLGAGQKCDMYTIADTVMRDRKVISL